MKRKMFLGLILAMTMMVGTSLNVFAADVSVEGTQSTATCTTSMTVTEEMVGGALVVTIPAEVNCFYLTKEDGIKYATGELGLSGGAGAMQADKKLLINVPTTVKLTNTVNPDYDFTADIIAYDDESVDYASSTGNITVSGSPVAVNNLMYSAAELAYTTEGHGKSCYLSKEGVYLPLGTYTGTIDFYISILDKDVTPNTETVVFS